jgi:GDP-L-fucose synthase
MMGLDDTILVTGANGLVGTHVFKLLQSKGFTKVVGIGRAECDLTDYAGVRAFFTAVRPLYVFHAAAYVAGIMGNMRNQALSFLRNTLINTHVVAASQTVGVRKICAMGTVAMYPDAPTDARLREDMVWRGPPHSSERGYAHAKRGMLAQLDVYRESYGLEYACALSTNLYGPGDRFDIENGHVIPSLVRKFFEANKNNEPITVWGDGSARRDFVHVEDAARALLSIMDKVDGPVNLATGKTHAIREVVKVLAHHVGMDDRIIWDTMKPSGQVFREYDVSILSDTGFRCQIDLPEGLCTTYDWYATNVSTARR